MKLHLSNLDELIQKVRNASPKSYLNEAIVSYRAGAYRAALITTWIAVCVDIIEKIKELSAAGDTAAKSIEDRLNNINPGDHSSKSAFERDLLGIACNELEFLSRIEMVHLERLKEDRNICAHPTFSLDGSQFSPIAETALSYIVQSANYLLIHPPVKGKVVVQRLFDLINEPSFPDDDEKAHIVLSSNNNLGSVRPSSVRNLVIVLLKRIFRDENSISVDLLRRIVSALGAISRLYPEVYVDVIDSKLSPILGEINDKQLKRIFPFLARRKEEWDKIENSERVRIERLLTSMTIEELISYRVVSVAEKVWDLNNVLQEIITKFKDIQKTKLLLSVASPVLKNHAIKLFIGSLSFDSAENIGENIITPLCKYFDTRDVEQILEGACLNTGARGYNQILPAGSIDLFFESFYHATKETTRPEHGRIWLSFRSHAETKGHKYACLDSAMIKDGLLAPLEDEPDQPIELPF